MRRMELSWGRFDEGFPPETLPGKRRASERGKVSIKILVVFVFIRHLVDELLFQG